MTEDLKSLNGRLATFKDFPTSAAVRPRDLADAGFCYTGNGDDVICAFDGCELGEWESGDVPMREHERHYPGCSFFARKTSSNVSDAGHQQRLTTLDTASPSGQVVGTPIFKDRAIQTGPIPFSLKKTQVARRVTARSDELPVGVQETSDKLQSYMDRDVVQMMIEDWGCQIERMRTVCELLIRGNKELPKANKLMEAYWDLEEAERAGLD